MVVFTRQHRLDLHRLDVGPQCDALGVGVGHRLGLGRAFLGFGQFVEEWHVFQPLPQLGDTPQLTLGVGQLAGHLLGVFLVVPQLRIGGLVFEFVDPSPELLEVEHLLHCGEGRVEGVEVC